jgi:hypothetical protein
MCLLDAKSKDWQQHLKHITVRCLCGREIFQNRQVAWCFARLVESCSDGMTKTLPHKLLKEHTEALANIGMLEGGCQEKEIESID